MTELAAWLLDQIADDEVVARAAAIPEGEHWHCHSAPYEGTWIVGGTRDDCEQGIDHEYDSIEPWHPLMDRHTPARVLAECEAKRRMVALHSLVPDPEPDEHYLGSCRMCVTDGPDAQGWPCDTVRVLALPYADRPGYDEGWRP